MGSGAEKVCSQASERPLLSTGERDLSVLAAFLILFLATKYVSLGSITAAVSFPITLFAVDYRGVALALAFFCAITIIVRHSENIKRLIAGRENKFTTRRDISYKLDKNDF